MATVTVVAIERSGPAIRAALAEHAPGDEHRFATELRDALARAADDLDPPRPQAVLARWRTCWPRWRPTRVPADERARVERAKAGDFTGLSALDEHGN